jgi:hypothetical protein
MRRADSQAFEAYKLRNTAEHHEDGNGEIHHATTPTLAQILEFATLSIATSQPSS